MQRANTNSIHTAHALIGAETQRADGLTVRGNRGKINEGSDREGGGGGEVETETERQNH